MQARALLRASGWIATWFAIVLLVVSALLSIYLVFLSVIFGPRDFTGNFIGALPLLLALVGNASVLTAVLLRWRFALTPTFAAAWALLLVNPLITGGLMW